MNDREWLKYLRSVERRLNLPKDIKARVMSDFASSIHARQEKGMTDEEILAELGDAKTVAADLNEQMKEFVYRKSPWRFLFGALAAYGGASLLKSIFGQILYWLMQIEIQREAASIGVIGGADGPTAIFVTSSVGAGYVWSVLLLIVGIWGFLRLRKCKK